MVNVLLLVRGLELVVSETTNIAPKGKRWGEKNLSGKTIRKQGVFGQFDFWRLGFKALVLRVLKVN